MIEYRNNCVQCPQGCMSCGRRHQATLVCDDCREDANRLFYGIDGNQYCKFCITEHLEEVRVEQ